MSDTAAILAILTRVNQIYAGVQTLLGEGTKIMSALSDLQAAEAAIATAVQNAITLIQNLQSGSVSDADVEAVVTQLQTAAANLNAAVQTPPPSPTPPPTPTPGKA